MAWSESAKVVELRQRSAAVDVIVGMLDGWRLHQSGRNASLLSFWSFLSIFPLMIAATTILGLVLQNNEDLQERIIDGALEDIPVLGAQLANDPTSLNGSWLVLIFGLAAALWSATRAFAGAHVAFDDIWEIPIDERDPMPTQRLRALIGLALIGAAQLSSLALSAFVQRSGLHYIGMMVVTLGTLVVNIAIIAAVFRYLTSASPSWNDVWPGAISAAVSYAILQHYATLLVTRITENASDTYGQFALVLGLVTWLGLIAIATLMSAELNAALVRRRRDIEATDRVESGAVG